MSANKSKGQTVPFDGTVYCVTTHNGTVIVRRAGKVCITGNSAVQRHHALDPTMLLLDRLRTKTKHDIQYGGYMGFSDYRFQRSANYGGYRFIIYHYHGAGGSSPVTKGTIGFARKMWVEADVVWMGHVHNRLNMHSQRLRCPERGDTPDVKDIREVLTGAYFDTYTGQSQQDIRESGRRSNYAADAGLAPQGKGGARVLVTLLRDGVDVRVTQ